MTEVTGASVVTTLLATVPTPAARESARERHGPARRRPGPGGEMDPSLTGMWRPTAALVRSVVTATVLLLAALALGRPDSSCSPRRSAWRPPWPSRTLRGARPRTRTSPRTAGCTRARARGSGSGSSPSDELEQVTATLSPPAYVATQPPSGSALGVARPGVRRRAPGVGGQSRGGGDVAPPDRSWWWRPRAGAATAGAPSASRRSTWSRSPRSRRSAPARAPHPVGLIGPEPVATWWPRLGVLRDQALPAGRPAAPGQLAYDAAHRRAALRRDQRPGGQLGAASWSTR